MKLYRQATQLAHDEAPWLYLFTAWYLRREPRAVDWEPTSDESTSTVMLGASKKK